MKQWYALYVFLYSYSLEIKGSWERLNSRKGILILENITLICHSNHIHFVTEDKYIDYVFEFLYVRTYRRQIHGLYFWILICSNIQRTNTWTMFLNSYMFEHTEDKYLDYVFEFLYVRTYRRQIHGLCFWILICSNIQTTNTWTIFLNSYMFEHTEDKYMDYVFEFLYVRTYRGQILGLCFWILICSNIQTTNTWTMFLNSYMFEHTDDKYMDYFFEFIYVRTYRGQIHRLCFWIVICANIHYIEGFMEWGII